MGSWSYHSNPFRALSNGCKPVHTSRIISSVDLGFELANLGGWHAVQAESDSMEVMRWPEENTE
jgi:hypothetical protein